jgi:DNA-binding transcriptional LysR family regulator
MNTRFVETFVTLARLCSFRATARELHTTAGTISLRIKCLEEELGTPLVDRRARTFRLTQKGEQLVPHACALLEATRSLRAAARCDGYLRGRLKLGVIEAVAHSWLAPYLRQMNLRYPDMEIEVLVDGSLALSRRMRERELDLAILIDGEPGVGVLPEVLGHYALRWTDHLASGEFVALPVCPAPPPIVVSLWLQADGGELAQAAARGAREACASYSNGHATRQPQLPAPA